MMSRCARLSAWPLIGRSSLTWSITALGFPAKGLYPPALPGFNPDLKGLSYDPKQAQQLLAQSKYGGPQGLPAIVFTSQGIGNTAGPDVAAMVQMWEQNLGVKITIENLEPDKYSDLLYSGQHGQIFSGAGAPIIPTRRTLPMFYSIPVRSKISAITATRLWMPFSIRPASSRMLPSVSSFTSRPNRSLSRMPRRCSSHTMFPTCW